MSNGIECVEGIVGCRVVYYASIPVGVLLMQSSQLVDVR